jgi:hypothetical protein
MILTSPLRRIVTLSTLAIVALGAMALTGFWHPNAPAEAMQMYLPKITLPTVIIAAAGGYQSSPQTSQATGHQSPPATGTLPRIHQGAKHEGQPQTDDSIPPMEHNGNQTANSDRTQNRLLTARFTTATGYIALGLLGLTLFIGPAILMLHRRTPVSTYLARDVGTWAAINRVVHVIAGFFVHGPPAPFGARVI